MSIDKLISDPAVRQKIYIENARKLIHGAFGISFDSDLWQLPAKREAGMKHTLLNFKEFREPFRTLLKALIANESAPVRGRTSFGHATIINSAKKLDPEISGLKDLTLIGTSHFKNAAQHIRDNTNYSNFTKWKHGQLLAMLAKSLTRNRLTKRRIGFRNPFSVPEADGDEHLIPRGAIQAFGDIWQQIMRAGRDQDRILACAVALLFCTGYRINELLSMPVDCWHPGVGKDREGRFLKGVYLGYSPEKNGLTDNTFPKWIPTALVPLVKACVDEIYRITEPFRENARAMFEGRVNLPGLDDSCTYTGHNAANMLGLTDKGLRDMLKKKGTYQKVKGVRGGGGHYAITAEQIREIVRSRSFQGRVITRPWPQELHESLFVVSAGFYQVNDGGINGTAERVKSHSVYNFVADPGKGGTGIRSCFERFNRKDTETGKFWGFGTHDPRHTLTTWLYKHGVSELQVAAWFARDVKNPAEANKNYIHLKAWEIMRIIDESLSRGEFRGPWADILASIKDPVRRAEIKKTMVGNVSFSKLGVCSHPEGTTPPTTPEACARCPGIILIKGNEGHLEETRKQLAESDRKIEAMNRVLETGKFLNKHKWLSIEMERRAGLVDMLEIHMDATIPNGTAVQRPPRAEEKKCV